METGQEKRPVIGLALGGGGARGYAHLGVIKALQKANIPVDVIAGTSMGALIGAVYAAGWNIDEAEDIATSLQWRQLLHLADIAMPRRGVIAGTRVEEYFDSLVMGRHFDKLEKEMVIVATDIRTAETVYLKNGPVARAIRASIALPGIFYPVEQEGRLLVDGTITEPVPVKAARYAGADLIVAVDVSSSVDRAEIFFQALNWWKRISAKQPYRQLESYNIGRFLDPVVPESLHIVRRSLELNNQYVRYPSQMTQSAPQLLVRPAVGDIRWFEFHRAKECIQAGEVTGRQLVKQINAVVEHRAAFPNNEQVMGWDPIKTGTLENIESAG